MTEKPEDQIVYYISNRTEYFEAKKSEVKEKLMT